MGWDELDLLEGDEGPQRRERAADSPHHEARLLEGAVEAGGRAVLQVEDAHGVLGTGDGQARHRSQMQLVD